MDERAMLALRRCLDVDPYARDGELHMLVDEISLGRLTQLSDCIHHLFDQLSATELARMVKLFTRLESIDEPYRLRRGSTTSVPRLLRELAIRDNDLAQELTIWAFHTASNSYIPFGTDTRERDTASTVAAYHRLRSQRASTATAIDTTQRTERQQRVAERARVHAEGRQVHANKNARRSELLAASEELGATERLARIANFEDLPIGAYPADWASLPAAKLLPAEIRIALQRRLAKAPRGPWRDLATALAEQKP